MSYRDDVQTLVFLEKMRVFAIVVAVACAIAGLTFDIPWIIWPRILAWGAAGVVCALEARAEKRLGRDPDASWLRMILFLLVAAMYVVSALRA
jgi:hypothetical protein